MNLAKVGAYAVSLIAPVGLRRFVKRLIGTNQPVSDSYVLLQAPPDPALRAGFSHRDVADRQAAAFEPVLAEMRKGRPRRDFIALAEAVTSTGLVNPSVLEVGCGSGWNNEVISRLTGRPIRYLGVDYSTAMARLGARHYPQWPFVTADATALPFSDRSFDIVLSGTVLMHVYEYARAIREARRVAGSWCIFHTVPIVRRLPTQILRKKAYGVPVVEVLFNEHELKSLFRDAGLDVSRELDSLEYDVHGAIGEHTVTKTYVCRVV